MKTENRISRKEYLAIIIWMLWMLIITISVYLIESTLLFVFCIVGSCLVVYLCFRLVRGKNVGEEK